MSTSGPSNEPTQDAPELNHWADQAAKRTIAAHPDVATFVVAAGITPSGVVHIGNFREVMTVDLVARALRDAGKTVRFIYSWDDFDVFRKVPEGMPQREMLADNLRKSIVDVPDPHGEADSYASYNIGAFESSLAPMGIAPEFIRQAQRYRKGAYAQGILRALEGKDTIRAILDAHRKEPLASDWLPLAGFCNACSKDELTFSWSSGYEVSYQCQTCQHQEVVDLRNGGNIKLPWRIDWPMRWAFEGVCFEPGGKDHSSAGGSYDTGKEIVAQVYNWQAPQYVAYDFVRIKGKGGKISSSAGGAITVADALEVYEPEVLRWIFASYRPNTEFQISFDLDTIKIYEDHDRMVTQACQALDGGKNDGKRKTANRIMHLASPGGGKLEHGQKPPFLPGFRGLSMTLQVYDGDIERALAYHKTLGDIGNSEDERRFRQRAACIWNWITKYAPDDFRYRLRDEAVVRELEPQPKLVLQRLVASLRESLAAGNESDFPDIRTLCEGTELDPSTFSPVVYDLMIDREKGPKMVTLVTQTGFERTLSLIEPSAQ